MSKKDKKSLKDITIIKKDNGEIEVVRKKEKVREELKYGKNKKEFNKINKKLKK